MAAVASVDLPAIRMRGAAGDPIWTRFQAERCCRSEPGEVGQVERRLLVHRSCRRQAAGDYLGTRTIPPGGRPSERPLHLHGPLQASELGRVLRHAERSSRAGFRDSGSRERGTELHGRRERQPSHDDRADDVRHVATAGAFVHPRSERRVIRRSDKNWCWLLD